MEYYNLRLTILLDSVIDGINDDSKVVGWFNSGRRDKVILDPKSPTAPPEQWVLPQVMLQEH